MAKFDLKGLLNDRSVPDRQQDQKIVYRNPKDLIPSEENFYNTEKLERLKQSIKLLGILQPLLIENRDGKDYVIAGHCRRKCCIDLLNEGNDRFSRVPCIYKTQSELEQDAGQENDIVRQIMIIQANCYRDKSDWEKMTETLKMEGLVKELREKTPMEGKTRDILKDLIGTSGGQLGRYHAISTNLCEQLMSEFEEDRIKISVAYEASKLNREYQKQACELCVTGHWDETSRTYYVTAMSADNGYVDIDALYGTGDRYLTTRKGLRLTTRAGKYILVQSGGAHIRKRFSISKAKDGKIGLSYDLHSSTLAVRKRKDGKTLIPASITFSATQNDNGLVRSYSGRYSIQETEDGTTYTLKYVSTSDEIQKIYTPSSVNVKVVRCTLLSAGGVSELDTQTVIILADAEGLTDDIKKAQGTADQAKEAIVVTNQNVANIETSMEGFRTELSETTTDLHGLTDNTLLYNVKYHDNSDGTTTLTAAVYKNGTDVTKTYPDRWFTWSRKTESGEIYLGYGYSITVNNSDYEFGGVCVGIFATYDTLNLTTRSGKQLTTRSGKHITIWREK